LVALTQIAPPSPCFSRILFNNFYTTRALNVPMNTPGFN